MTRTIGSRDAIRDAAAQLFAKNGYASTSIRDIAARASYDPALVIRHFGSKEQLFLETMQLSTDEVLRFDGPLAALGPRLIRAILDADDRLRSTYVALVRASGADRVGSALRDLHERAFVTPLVGRLEGEDRELRARLIAAMVGGIMYSLWTVGDEALVAVETAAVAARYGASLQLLITPEPELSESVSGE